ncbi:MAG: flagellar export chaperone FlgN [Candidatus Scalindua sp.]
MKYQNSTHIEKIISYLIRKKEYYEEILKLTKKQADIIKSSNTNELNLIITAREKYVKDIKRLDELNIKIQEEIISNRKTLILDKRFNSLLRQLQSIITELMHYNQESMSLLSSSMDNTKTKINNLNKRRRAQQSMREYGMRPARLVDVIQ